jgi:signal peptide peptidase SppA
MADISNILSELRSTPWAITPERARTIANVLSEKTIMEASRQMPSYRRAIEAREEDPETLWTGSHKVRVTDDGTAVVPIRGTISKRISLMGAMSGGTSADMLRSTASELRERPDVQSVVFDVDSGGGSIEGVELAAREIRALREEKRTVAVANDKMYSAAYWLGSAASKVFVTPSSGVGSIGVLSILMEQSEALEEAGINVEVIRSTEDKARPTGYEEFREADLEKIQDSVNLYHERFVEALEMNRDFTSEKAARLADGNTHDPQTAMSKDLADHEASLEEVIAALDAENREARELSRRASELAEENERLEAKLEEAEERIETLEAEVEEMEETVEAADAALAEYAKQDVEDKATRIVEAAHERGQIKAEDIDFFVEMGVEQGTEYLERVLGSKPEGSAVPVDREIEEAPGTDTDENAPTSEAERRAYSKIPRLAEKFDLDPSDYE